MENISFEYVIFKKILDNYISGCIFFDPTQKIIYANKIFEIITGLEKVEVIGKSLDSNVFKCENEDEKPLCSIGCPIEDAFNKKKLVKKECFINNNIFGKIPVIISAFPIYNDNEFIGVCCNIDDNALKFLQNKKIKYLEKVAMIDELTGLPNRRFLKIMLDKCFGKLVRFENYSFGIIFFDIDNFKKINDTFGHKVGDDVLKRLAYIAKKMFRKYDVCCRYGGEEFVAVLQYLNNSDLYQIAERLRVLVENNLKIPKYNYSVTISIGATKAKKDDTFDSLIKRADKLMYQSKVNGKNQVSVG